jgi:polysaccharide biosynthesis protein PslH
VKRNRVLYLCGQAPWLRNGGALLRNYWMIDALAKRYAVDLVVADEPGPIPASFAALVDDYAAFPRNGAQRGGLSRIAGAAAPGSSTLTAGWTNAALHEHVANRLGQYPYAAIQVDLPMLAALPRRDAIPIVYNAHNCESALLARRAREERPHLGVLFALDAIRVRQQERTLIGRSVLVAACAESDLADFARFVPGVRAKAAIVPNGVEVTRYAGVAAVPAPPGSVLITGSMDWRPNVLGLRWFLRHGLERLRARVPDVVVRVAGRMQPELVAELKRYPNVEAIPSPELMEPHLSAATVVAAPIVASSGTRLRILEAWAAGRPVVTTTAGAAGLDHVAGRELAIADDAVVFGDAVADLLLSPERCASIVGAASARVQAYDWPRIGARLLDAYERVINDTAVRTVPTVREDTFALAGR